jgi:hypothetical protein
MLGAVYAVLGLFGAAAQALESIGSRRFEDIRAAVFSDPYTTLPRYRVEKDYFGAAGDTPDNALRAAARRTLTTDHDLVDYPDGRKLFQPNGICFAGEWRINHANAYTGLLSFGTRVPAIVRVSVMLGETERGRRRTLGMGVKLFATARDGVTPVTRNLLVMDAVAGSRRPHVLDAVLDNHPKLGGLPSLGTIPTALRIRADLNAADAELSPAGPNLRFRPIRHLADLGADGVAAVRAPRWIRLSVTADTPRIDATDFREELALRHYPRQRLVYIIEVADAADGGKSRAAWKRLGELELREDVVSATCDQRLHFAHPRLERAP